MRQWKKDNRGFAMIVVVCLMAVLLALSCALLTASSLLMGNAGNAARREQVRIFTLSVNEELERAMTISRREQKSQGANAMWTYVNECLGNQSWPAGEVRTFQMDNSAAIGDNQKIEFCDVELSWELLGEYPVEKEGDSDGETVVEQELALTAEVTCGSGRNRYTAVSVFLCRKEAGDGEYYWYLSRRE